MSSHLDPEVLAELQEGLLDPQGAAAAAAHLADCARCRADDTALREVRHELASAPAVGPVPDEVAARIEQALSGAAAGSTGTTDEPADAPGLTTAAVTVTPLPSGHRSPVRGTRLLQAAAAVVLLLAAGAIGISAWHGGAGTGDHTASKTASEAGKAAPGHFPLLASGTDYTQDTVVKAVPRLLGATGPGTAKQATLGSAGARPDAASSAAAQDAATPGRTGAQRLTAGPALADCVTALADGPVTPLAVDVARFRGKPAAVIVLPTPDDPAKVDVWVVGPECSQADAKMDYFARVNRP